MLPENRKKYFSHKEQHSKLGKSCGRYRYKVHGLHIASDILLPELLTEVDNLEPPGVSISIGIVPAGINNPIKRTNGYQVSENHFLFEVPCVGR